MSGDLLKSYRFREERQADWQKLDLILTRAENGGVKSLSDEQMLALPRLYRQAVSSLSVARSISLDQNAITYLEPVHSRLLLRLWRPYDARRADDAIPAARLAGSGGDLRLVHAVVGILLLRRLGARLFLCLQDMEWYWTFHGQNFMEGRNPDATVEYLRSTIYTQGHGEENSLPLRASCSAIMPRSRCLPSRSALPSASRPPGCSSTMA